MMDEFLLRALLAGIGVALAAGPLGVFVVWRRMAYFGEALSHSALLGVALGVFFERLGFGLPFNLAILIVCLIMAGLIALLQQSHPTLATDTTLGILSHTALALGLVIVTLVGGLRLDLIGVLFGDVLASSWNDVVWIFVGGSATLLTLAWLWKPLLNITVHEGLAHVEGVPVARVRILFMFLVALTVATAFRIVGALLITALMIIPAAAARPLAKTPLKMAIMASSFGVLSVILGLVASFQWDLPSGPAIVLVSALFFIATHGYRS